MTSINIFLNYLWGTMFKWFLNQ